MKRTVSMRALIARINRKLAHEYEALCKTSWRSHYRNDLGEYYIRDVYRNTVIAMHCDPVQVAREIGVLGPHEQVAENEA